MWQCDMRLLRCYENNKGEHFPFQLSSKATSLAILISWLLTLVVVPPFYCLLACSHTYLLACSHCLLVCCGALHDTAGGEPPLPLVARATPVSAGGRIEKHPHLVQRGDNGERARRARGWVSGYEGWGSEWVGGWVDIYGGRPRGVSHLPLQLSF